MGLVYLEDIEAELVKDELLNQVSHQIQIPRSRSQISGLQYDVMVAFGGGAGGDVWEAVGTPQVFEVRMEEPSGRVPLGTQWGAGSFVRRMAARVVATKRVCVRYGLGRNAATLGHHPSAAPQPHLMNSAGLGPRCLRLPCRPTTTSTGPPDMIHPTAARVRQQRRAQQQPRRRARRAARSASGGGRRQWPEGHRAAITSPYLYCQCVEPRNFGRIQSKAIGSLVLVSLPRRLEPGAANSALLGVARLR
jgi:hypothetical protein